ncbi:hypothetical protein SPBRAN_1476 [uncultured Candidatus Thioglobus sp.]|nr:hypothetical protein SPBRAN_1476 [uncultured Candidatus Thioglobus sp.]
MSILNAEGSVYQKPKNLLVYISGDFSLFHNAKIPYTESQLNQLDIYKSQSLVVLLSRHGYRVSGRRSTGDWAQG